MSDSVVRCAWIDGDYRYTLARSWAEAPGWGGVDTDPAVWIGLNPSTADGFTDDNTIRRVMNFSRDWGYSCILMVNLFALRSRDPRALATHPDPVGPHNDAVLRDVIAEAGVVIAAWGAHAFAADRAAKVLAMVREAGVTPMCLATTKSGAPKHPLYLHQDTRLRVLGE